MKIKKTPPRKLAPPPSSIRGLIKTLSECREEAIPNIVAAISEWTFPRGDLFHWIGVLNKFDTILENTCQTYDLKKLQVNEFTPATRSLVLAVLKFSRMLLENCTNRNLYSSYEHLNDLLFTRDIEVLEATLRLMLRPAQRMSSQRTLRTNFNISHDRITDLAHGWGTKEHGLDFLSLSATDVEISEDLTTVNFQFYRALKSTEVSVQTDAPPQTVTPAQKSKASTAQTTPSASTTNLVSGGTPKINEGLTIITVPNVQHMGKSDRDIMTELVEQHQVPEEFHFALLTRIRIATGITNAPSRRTLLVIRILAIAIMAHVVSETQAQSKVFMYEPEIVNNLAELIQPDKRVPFEIQTVALYALDAIAKHRSKINEVLTAVNASANHGTLLYLLRKVISAIDSENLSYPQDFLDALFSFISYIITTQAGGQMVMAAGIIPTLLLIFQNKHSGQLKNMTKVVGLLDSIVYGFTNSFPAFCNANGLDILVGRIKTEVEYCTQLAQTANADAMEDVTTEKQTATQNEPEESIIPHERLSLLKAMLKFVLHMMQTSGTADGLRNLIDSSLPLSLKSIMEQPKVFGSSVFALAVNVMSTFIHNEPTSLPILQEVKLPQTFLETINADIPVSVDVISAIPNAFGAICLNAPGLEMFNDVKPIDHFFSIFTSADHLRCLSDGDTASILGTSIDELMRHHPTLKNDVIEAILAMLRRLLGMGQLENARPDDENYALLIGRPDDMVDTEMATAPIDLVADSEKAAAVDQNKPEEKKESVLVQTIDVTARFLEGLFQNNSHCREFFKQNGLELLLKLYSLPLAPYDFANSPASYSLSHLFHLVTEVNSVATVHEILKRVQTVLTDAKPFLEYEGPTAMIADFIDLNELDSEKVKNANEVFRTLITLHGFVGLLSDVCCAPVFSHSKSGMAVIQEFIGLAGETIIPLLGQLHRACVWENILLKNAVPKSWYAAISKAKKPGSELGASGAGPITALETLIEDMDKETDSNAEEPVNQNDRKVKNTKFLKHLVTQMPNCLVPIFQGLTKMLMARRVMDATQKKQAYKVADFVSCLLRDHLTWSRIQADDSVSKYNYLTVMLGLLSLLFLDDRSQMSLQTVLVLAFDRNQGTEHLFDTLRLLWKNAEAIQSISEAEAERDQATKEKLARIHSGLEITLNIFQFLGSAKLLHDSPHTSSIVSKEKDRGTPEFFDAHEWLIGMRAKLLPVVKELFDSPYLKRCPPNLVRSIVRNLVQLLKGDGEVNQRAEGLGPVGPAPSIFAPRPMIPDQEGVQTLTEMGFPRAAAESALLRCANQVARAIDYLFTHPETVDAAPRHAPPTDNTEDVTTDAATAAAAAPVPPAEATGSGSESVPAPSQPEAGAAEFLPGPELADDDDDDEEDESALEQALALSMNAESAPTETVIEGPEAMSTTPETAPMVATPEAEPDINSTDDAEAVENASTEKADKGKQKDKGKEKEVSRIEELRALRELIKVTLAPHVLEILDQTDDVIFDIRDLFAILCKDNADQTLDFLLSNVDQYRAASNTDEEAKKALGVRMRLLALLFRESSAQAKIPTFSPKLFPTLLDMVGIEASQSVDTPTSSWLASVLLVVEAFISQADEPKTVELEHKSDDEKKEGANEDKAMEIDEKEDKDNKMVIDKESFTEDQRSRLLRYCVELSKRSKPTKDNLHAVLRILVRLTRHYSAAVEFVEMEGLQLLFAQPRSGIDGFQGQQAFVILILRHIIEDTRVLQNTMEKEINSWFTHPHPRLVDVNTFVRNNAHVVLREPPVFVEATKIICKLTKHDRSGSTNQITLARNEADAAPTVSASERVDDAKDTNLATDEKDLTAVPLETPKKHPYTSEVSETVVHFLINELLASRASTVAAPIPVAQTPVASTLAKGKDSATPEEESSVSDQVKADDKNNDNGAYTYTGFLLQCLVELLSSYPSCKVDVINFAQLNRRRTSKDPSTPSKPRAIFLNFLLNELLPYGSVNPHEEQTRKRFALSTWAASVLVALCSNGGNSDDSKQQPELGQVRRFVLDGILRSFKDAIVSTDIIGVKYGKLLALADLCHRILNARPSSGGPGGKPSDDMSTNVAKIMLEKSFVSTLTNAVSEIDLNFPNSKMVINALLRPLEQLTKIAIKMGRAAEPAKDGKRRTNEDNRNVFPSTEDNTEDEEAPNLYRHSALGMYESGIPSEEDEEDLGTTEDEEGYDEGGDYEDETGSDMSDITDEESLSVDDMEEDLEIGIHHRHYSDMDDEDEEDEEAGTGEDDPHTEEEYDPPAEEVERGMTWDVDDVDDADEPHAHPVMLVPDEIEEEVESGEEPDRLRHRNRFAQDDAGGDMMVDEEGDEDEESETGEDDEGDLEENDGAVLEDMEHEMPDDRFGMPFELGAPVALDDEIGGWARAHRSFINLGTRRHGRALPGRRAVFEVPMHGEGSFNMWGGDSVDAGRFSFFDESAEFQIVGRPFSRTPGSWNDDIATHPLLANRTTGLPTAAGGALDAPRLRPTRSSGLNEFQAFEEMIGGSAVQLLETLLNRHPRPGMHPLPGAYRVEVNNGPGGIVSGIELDRLFSRPPTSGQDAGNRTTPADPFAALQDFSPMTTAERWHQESRMMYGNTMTDKALRLVDPVLNVLLPLAIEEEKKRKEKEEKEREEQRLKVEVDRKAAEELQQRLKEEADRKSEEAAREHPSQLTEVPVEDAQTTTLDVELGPEGVMDVQMTDDEVSLPQEMDTFVSSAEMDLVPAPTTQLDNVPAAIAEMEEAGQAAAIDTEDTSAGSSAVTASAPTTVLINGTPVDISGTGIDPTFLEALPDDLRQEVLNQHFRERRTTTQATETAASISPEFLDALPPDIREEVLQQEALERERRERQQQTEAQPAVPVDLDPASFLASLDPILRETVLMEQDETFLATLPPALVAEANAVRARASRRYVHQSVRQRAPPVVTPALPVATPKKPAVHRDAVQLVDRAQLATLVRLLFLPQSISKNLLNRLLLNLCENSRTRGDLISLLLSILQDGSGDLAAVDKSFAQMSLRPKVTPKTPKKLANQQAMSSSQNLGENVPNLIAQRCLEALTCIVQYNEQSINYFLSENDNITTLKRFSSKKGKGKEKSGTSRYPIVVLLSLLDRDIFTKNTALMDQLMHLLCAICRPLSSLAKKEEEKDAEKSNNTSAAATVTAVPAAMATVATTAPESTVTNSASSTANSVEDPPPSISSENNIDAGVTSNPTNSEAPAAESSKPAAKDNDKEKSTLKPPVIPEQYLRLVVHVLTAGECSSKTFQSTLTVIQHLSALEGARYVITDELVDSARNLGEAIHEDLKELIPVLENAMTGVDVQGATLSKFSPSSSQQAKLLRVLKNIDYMYTRKQQTSATAPVAHPPTAVETPTAGAPTVAETEEADGMMARTLTGDGKSTGYTFTEDEEKVLQIYDGLSFTPLWQKLGHCLTLVHEKEDMVHVATVLLPLIESFMVVSKYVGIKGPSTVQKAVTRGSASPRASLESHEDLFFAFTEEHRKILNTMVRNNPSLMSGSFSLLVRNPKMLEFDNKRNYFTQQLHKRTNVREHYNTVQLNVRRPHVFEDSFHQLQHRSGDEIKYGKLSVRFYDEEGVDAGGVTREWFSVLARQMFNPDYALFKTSAADKLTYQPNRASWVNSDHLSFFKFVGRVIGKAIYDGRLLDAYFTRSFYKHILGRPVDYKDVEAVDPEYYKSLVWMLDNDITDIMDLTFSVETDDFGKMKTVDLKPNGRDIAVTEENKQEYVKLVSEQKLTLAIKDQIKSFLDGFHAIILPHLISIFNEQELELLISGLPDIDIDDWKNTTEYQGYTSSSPQVQWFWRAVRSFDQEERAKLLQFATGTSKVPLEGFTHLQGVNGVQKFQIHKDYSSNGRLPSAHTCFNQIDLPEYDSYETLRSQLLTAIQECATGFGFG